MGRVDKQISRIDRARDSSTLERRLARLQHAFAAANHHNVANELLIMRSALAYFTSASTIHELQHSYFMFLELVVHGKVTHPSTQVALEKVAAEYGKRLFKLELAARHAKQAAKLEAREKWLSVPLAAPPTHEEASCADSDSE